jgi:hypothetical protein
MWVGGGAPLLEGLDLPVALQALLVEVLAGAPNFAATALSASAVSSRDRSAFDSMVRSRLAPCQNSL